MTLLESRPQKGDEIRTVRSVRFQTRAGWGVLPVGTPGIVTSAGGHYLFATIAGHEMELLDGEWERA